MPQAESGPAPARPAVLRRFTEPIAALLACAFVIIIFFGEFPASHFQRVAGDLGDTRLAIVLMEHWWAVVQRLAPMTSPNFFWPAPGVLGYSDTYFLHAIPYVVLRWLGCDPYLSFELVLVGIKIFGFVALWWFLRSFLGCGAMFAILGASLFTLSNMAYISTGHSQFAITAFVPLLCGLALLGWRHAERGRKALAACLMSTAAILLALMLFTAFYIGWFTILAAGTLLGFKVLLEVGLARSLEPVAAGWRQVLSHRPVVSIALVVFAVAMIPFAVTYGPMLRQSGGRPYAETLQYAATPSDVINVGSLNRVWGSVFGEEFNQRRSRFAGNEMERGWPLGILGIFVLGSLGSLRRLLRSRRRKAEQAVVLSAAASLTAGALWFLSVRIGAHSGWWLLFKLVPGTSAIRVPVRINFVLNLILIAVVITTLERWTAKLSGPRGMVTLTILASLLIAEQWNTVNTHHIDRPAELAWLRRASAPPAECRSFVVTQPLTPDRAWYANQIDGEMLARRLNIPTVNGYSGWSPPGWDFPFVDEMYQIRAERWARSQGIIRGFCGVDLQKASWTNLGATYPRVYQLGHSIDFRSAGAAQYQTVGWSGIEPAGTWTDGERATVWLSLSAVPTTDLLLDVEMHAFLPPERRSFKESVLVNGHPVGDWSIDNTGPVFHQQVRVPKALLQSPELRITFVNHDPRSPFDYGLSVDRRRLGMAVHQLTLTAAPTP